MKKKKKRETAFIHRQIANKNDSKCSFLSAETLSEFILNRGNFINIGIFFHIVQAEIF